jgi:hypothetical protein
LLFYLRRGKVKLSVARCGGTFTIGECTVAEDPRTCAPGWPGIAGRWTSSAKSGVGTAASRDSRVWFTLSHGILNEVYYPRVDHACTRDLGFIVTDGQTLFSEEKRHTRSETDATWLLAFPPI